MEGLSSNTKEVKLYSQRAIAVATFFGAPLAASILIRHNYIELGKVDEGKNALFIGIISTIALFVGIFLIPENIMSKFPNSVIPIAYTGIIYLIVEKIQGEALKKHETEEKEFISKWKAAGIGFVCSLLIMGSILGYAFYESNNPVYEVYDKQFEKFSLNETQSLEFYDHINTRTESSLLHELDYQVIPKWVENINIIKKTNEIENLPPELIEQNRLLLEYCQLRIEIFELFKKAIQENSGQYASKIDELNLEMEELLKQLE